MSRPSEPSGTHSLSEILSAVKQNERTVTVCNPAAPDRVLEEIHEYFSVQAVSVEAVRVEGLPQNFAVLHHGDEFIATSPLPDLYEVVRKDSPLADARDPDDVDYPDVLSSLDQSVFTEFGKRRMIVVSREIEQRAWSVDGGTLYAGFQELSRQHTQDQMYEKLGRSDLEVHLYGAPDEEFSDPPFRVHAHDTPEIRDHWFVVFRPPESVDIEHRVLLAEEREPNKYTGFWTEKPQIVEQVTRRLEAEYPPASP